MIIKIFLLGECMIELHNDMCNIKSSMLKPSNTLLQSFSGDVLNTAIYLNRSFSGIETHFISVVGKDLFSHAMLTFFSKENVGTELVFKSNNKILGMYSIQTDIKGERDFLYWRDNSAARDVMSFINDDVDTHSPLRPY